jgi:hypothetical protein
VKVFSKVNATAQEFCDANNPQCSCAFFHAQKNSGKIVKDFSVGFLSDCANPVVKMIKTACQNNTARLFNGRPMKDTF